MAVFSQARFNEAALVRVRRVAAWAVERLLRYPGFNEAALVRVRRAERPRRRRRPHRRFNEAALVRVRRVVETLKVASRIATLQRGRTRESAERSCRANDPEAGNGASTRPHS